MNKDEHIQSQIDQLQEKFKNSGQDLSSYLDGLLHQRYLTYWVELAVALESDLDILVKMEEEAERFGEAVGLDSVSTFECIVDKSAHFFMEMNTRIQVVRGFHQVSI